MQKLTPPLNLLKTAICALRRVVQYTACCVPKGAQRAAFRVYKQLNQDKMNRMKRLLTLLLLVCGMATGVWASSTPGALTGRFTINASGEKVVFSQGNLQYQASTDTWRFAENQYDYIGSANSSISESYTGWIDLFGWATNGLEANTATGKMPYYTGTTDEDYGPSITSGEFDKTIYDWGKAIDDSWHTLSNAEWNYIFAGRASYSSLYGFGCLFGVNGVFLLPDDWSWSETSIATAATAAGFAWSGGANTFSSNIISNNTLWSVMESAGAVFIPAAGYRQGTTINMSGNGGDYWSSTASSDKKAYRTSFYNEHLNLSNNYGRSDGISVRLVKDYQLQQDAEGNYLLSSADDWKDFAAIVNNTNPAANAKMTADIDLGTQITMIASDFDHPYQGTFDGQGHTLTVNWTTNGEDRIAPFRYAEGATIKRLHVDGSISKTDAYGRCPASILACSIGSATTTITECWSSVSLYAFDTIGGLFSVACDNSTTNIVDCVFSGMISASNSTGCSGGFASHADTEYIYTTKGAPTVNLTRGLNLGTFTGANPYLSYTFIRMGNPVFGTHTINSCYYKNVYGNAQGTQATSADLADGTITAALQNGRAEEVWVQDPLTNQPMLAVFAGKYTVPASGIGTFSAKAKFTLPEGLEAYYCKNYDATNGTIAAVAIDGVVPAETGVLLRGTAGATYTLTGTNAAAAEVTGNALVAVTEQTTIQQTDGDYTNFGLSGGTFKKVNTAGGTVGANRAYLHIPTSALSPAALARGISLAWDENVTSVSDVRIKTDDVRGEYYNLNGQRVTHLTKGLYIVNGKKVIIK